MVDAGELELEIVFESTVLVLDGDSESVDMGDSVLFRSVVVGSSESVSVTNWVSVTSSIVELLV